MKALITAAAIACVTAACASKPSVNDPSAGGRDVAFACTNGEELSVRFFLAQGRAVLLRQGQSIELPQQPSGSGFIYSNGPNTIRGKGADLTVEIGRMVPLQCKAKE
ncbi:MAG: MliC family protein [Proteobacteria bacterium]|nr:MliC family protein [Pseudomonadota bacterium]